MTQVFMNLMYLKSLPRICGNVILDCQDDLFHSAGRFTKTTEIEHHRTK
jgi:hypothetical protein